MEGTEKVIFFSFQFFFLEITGKSCLSNDSFHSHATFSYIKENNLTLWFIQAVFVVHEHGLCLL